MKKSKRECDRWMTASEAIRYLGISYHQLIRLMVGTNLKGSFRPGCKRVYFLVTDIRRMKSHLKSEAIEDAMRQVERTRRAKRLRPKDGPRILRMHKEA